MTDATDVHGPVDFLVVEFATDRADGQMADAVLDLVDRGIIELLDVVVVSKSPDGNVDVIEIAGIDATKFGGIGLLASAGSGLLDDDDVVEAAAAIEPGRSAAVLVYENSWARGFVAAARDVGAEFVASGRIPADALMATIDMLDGD
jgi:uncharacterized membrane protein